MMEPNATPPPVETRISPTVELLYQHSPEAGHARRIEIFDLGIAVPVAPGHHVLDPRAKYGLRPA